MKQNRRIAALPVRHGPTGNLEVLLITTRETHRWTVPKGWPSKRSKDHKMAAVEAQEEAGVTGKVDPNPIGTFVYRKRIDTGLIDVRVTLSILAVTKELERWPEMHQRTREWSPHRKAARRVRQPELRAIILGIGG